MFCGVSAKRGGEEQGECNYRNFRLWKMENILGETHRGQFP